MPSCALAHGRHGSHGSGRAQALALEPCESDARDERGARAPHVPGDSGATVSLRVSVDVGLHPC